MLVLVDLGSAVLSVRALLADGDLDGARVILADAPLVEGAIAAAATASIGGDLDARGRSRTGGLGCPQALRRSHAAHASALPDGVDLHARPAGALIRAAAAVRGVDHARAPARRRPTPKSILQVLGLGATGGTEITVSTAGADASDALDAIAELLERLA